MVSQLAPVRRTPSSEGTDRLSEAVRFGCSSLVPAFRWKKRKVSSLVSAARRSTRFCGYSTRRIWSPFALLTGLRRRPRLLQRTNHLPIGNPDIHTAAKSSSLPALPME